MMKISSLLAEISKNEFQEFQNLKGSYNLQGHVSTKKDMELRNMEVSAVSPNISDVGVGGVSEHKTPYGLWTSTVYKLETFTTKWENSVWVRPKNNYLHIFTIVNNPNIKHVKNKKDVENIKRNFGEKINWERVTEKFDAFHVWDEALETDTFAFWDVESTVWFRPKDYLKKQFTWKLDFGPISQLWKDFGEGYD